MTTIKNITSKSTQTKVFNSIMADMNNAFKYRTEYQIKESTLGNSREVYVTNMDSFLGNIYSYALINMIETVKPYCERYDNVYFCIETRTILNDKLEEVKVPAFVVCIGIKRKD